MAKTIPEIDLHILAEMSRNVLEWQTTSMLPEEAELRRYAANIRNAGCFEDFELLRKAESDVARAAMHFVISHVEEIDGKMAVAPAPSGYEGSPAHLAYEMRASTALMVKTAKVRPDVWQRHVTAILRSAALLETSPNATLSPDQVENAGPKTDQQIIDEVNDLAGLLARQAGYEFAEGYLFYISQDARGRNLWQRAVEIYEQIKCTEVHDALQAVLPDAE